MEGMTVKDVTEAQVRGSILVARVKFADSLRLYDYVVPAWVETSDMSIPILTRQLYAVVDSPRSGYAVVEVHEIQERLESDWDGEFKPLVCLVNAVNYEDWLAGQERATKIRRELERRAERRAEQEALEELAGDDPESRRLLEELRSLER